VGVDILAFIHPHTFLEPVVLPHCTGHCKCASHMRTSTVARASARQQAKAQARRTQAKDLRACASHRPPACAFLRSQCAAGSCVPWPLSGCAASRTTLRAAQRALQRHGSGRRCDGAPEGVQGVELLDLAVAHVHLALLRLLRHIVLAFGHGAAEK
jgi:hypothetical protein